MATVYSTDSESIEPNGSVFAGDHVVTSFPRHDVVKLDERMFLQWQQQVRFILAGYGLIGFLDGSLTAPMKFVQSSDGTLIHPVLRFQRLSGRRFCLRAGLPFVVVVAIFDLGSSVKYAVSLVTLLKGATIVIPEMSSRRLKIYSHSKEYRRLVALDFQLGVFSPVYPRPNVGIPSVDPRRPRPVHDSFGPALFVPSGGRPPNNYFRVPLGPQNLGQQIGDVGGTFAKAYGPPDAGPTLTPRGSFRPQLNDGPISSEPNHHDPTVPWRTKPRAHVFDVDSSSYDSSQFVGIPRLPEFHASDFSDATDYDSNFSGNDSYVPLPIGSRSWCPDSRAHTIASTKIHAVGNTVLSTPNKLLHLSNVLCVPSIRKNLISVSQFASDNNVFFKCHSSHCVIKDAQTQEVLMRGQVRDGLYHFTVDQSIPYAPAPSIHNSEVVSRSVSDNVFDLWHKRLGHPSAAVVKDVLNKCSIVSTKKCFENVCVACQQGKAHKLPFVSSTIEYLDSFELIISDLWGPASISCEGNLYYVSFIDMSSRFTWVYLLKRKSQALECFLQFQKMNGVAERKHRHVVETGLTLLTQANLPIVYWGYAFCSAIYLVNRLPTPVLKGHSPYQALYRTKPTYHHLRVFGCCCFPFLRHFLKHKLEFRSQPCTFLGYSSQHKWYYCLTPDGKVVVSRHVVFDESRFLFSASPAIRSDNNGSTLSDSVSTHVPVVQLSAAAQSCAAHPPILSPIHPTIRHFSTPDPSIPVDSHATCSTSQPGAVAESPDISATPLVNTHCMLVVQAEFDALSANSTWTLVLLPPRRKAIGCKWLFKVKRHPDGTIDRRKARLVAKGCSQAVGCDFKETDLTDEVFMQQPPGYVQIGPNGEHLVCRLTKALYGLRQAPHAWFDKLKGFLLSTGFALSKSDASLFLHCEFSLKDMGDLHYFLGIEVTRTSAGSLHLCQRKYTHDFLERSGLANAKSVNTPMISSSVLSKDDGDHLSDPTEYRSLAGALQYIVLTRPNIAYAVNKVCQLMHSPTSEHLVALKRILRYLYGTISYGLIF
ncbi:hypothetical protein CXB51_034329 [Gossypium anomalum]|uniref:Integrase catalytic domain-containing protein n=1 Tax=Gossypium anomalum TaxID=47600 RepID=A0A8J5XPB7_9ROSI|nr:hypothetical protein CXB51_034329 [Gossypium anomalum]